MDSAHKFIDMVKEFQISSVIELLDSFGESTLYKLPTATKACVRSRIMCFTSPALSLYCYRIVASLSPYCLGVIECVRAVSRDFIICA